MIRIGIDVQIADVSLAGIGQYTREVMHWLPAVDRDAKYIRLRPDGRRDFNMPQRLFWDQVQLPRQAERHGCDVLFKTGFSAPWRSSMPTVIVLHDLAARRFPRQLHRPSAWFYGHFVPWSLAAATRVIAVSQFTAGEAMKLLHVPPDKVRVIPEAGDTEARPEPGAKDDEIATRLKLPTKYLLHVGTIEPRKSLSFLVQVFNAFRQQHRGYSLLLAGREGWMSVDVHRTVQSLGLDDAVRFLGSVTNEERRVLYRRARGLVFPSRYEGFGLPPLEAMRSGTPVVAARNSAIPEVVGDAGLLITGYNADQWSKALAVAAEDETRRRELRAAGLERSRSFAWPHISTLISFLLHEVAHR